MIKNILGAAVLSLAFVTGVVSDSWAATGAEIDTRADVTLNRFYEHVREGEKLVKNAKGVLIFPAVYKAGIGLGGEYGEGVLRIKGKKVDYYSTAAGSIGFQLGVQKKSIVIIFTRDEALKDFRASSGWKAGVDASIAVVTVGAGGQMDTSQVNKPILGFVFGQKGLMYNLSLEGAKFTKIKK